MHKQALLDPTHDCPTSSTVRLWLEMNHLSGTIPSSFGLLQKLDTLDIADNDIIGMMPSEVCSNSGGFMGNLRTLEADCADGEIDCECCTCCSDCSPW